MLEYMFWKEDIDTIVNRFGTNQEVGLNSEQANQLLKINGFNELPKAKQKAKWKIILGNFLEPFMLVLITLLVIVSILQEWSELVVIALIILIETFISSYQEIKAQKSLEALKKLVQEQTVVIRDGKKHYVAARDLVVGDLIYLEAGMFVPADVRIIKSFNLQTNESLLTGESTSVLKVSNKINEANLTITQKTNMAFMSTSVVFGSGYGIVVKVADNTEVGKISKLLTNEKEPKSPLNKQVILLIRTISLIALVLGIIFFLIQYFVLLKSTINALVFAIALIIAVVPEGLLVVITVALSIGSKQMAKNHAIVKKLTAVETLGQVSIICSDKTGTLTENKMQVVKYYLQQKTQLANEFQVNNLQSQLFLDAMLLANNGHFELNKAAVGDPTETALLMWAENLGVNNNKIKKDYPREYEIPFDSQRKLMSSINFYEKDQRTLFIKGASENLINKCKYLIIDNEQQLMTHHFAQEIISNANTMAHKALRVLAVAYKPIKDNEDYDNIDKLENDLVFLGLVAMADLPRPEIKSSLMQAKNAGIITKMITGDNLETAVAIAQELDIITNKNQAIQGTDIDNLEAKELAKVINNYHVFARVAPEHKVKIVKALQDNNNIVAMTGDGVNDAPSLRAANIGVAMGITGTDVAKEAAQMVLTDDNFATIVNAVSEGRNIYDKLKRSIAFILIINFAQVMAIIIAAASGIGIILTPLQILWVNLIVESVLAITMTMGINNQDLMKKSPIKNKQSILKNNLILIFINSLFLAGLLILADLYFPGTANSFVVIINAPIFLAIGFSFSLDKSIFNKVVLKNKWFWMSLVLILILNLALIFIPGINDVFNVSNGTKFLDWFYCFLLSLIPLLFLEFCKLIKKLIKNAKV